MDKFSYFLGIDISKAFFDVSLLKNKNNHTYAQFPNSKTGIRQLHKWLKENKATVDNTLICMEHTGLYGKIIITKLSALGYSLWVEMSLKIIRSIGVQRGKSDKLDAARIAYYAMKNCDEAVIYQAPREAVDKLRKLLSIRDKLIVTKAGLLKNINELTEFDPQLAKLSKQALKNTLKGIDKDLAEIEKQLDLCLEDEKLKTRYKQVTSVPGVGRVTAIYLICFTNEFTLYENPRQLACYCGVVPFEHTSGKSIRGKPRVHYMANKLLKKLLHLCALSAVTYDQEMKTYYERKVAEGKNKMLVLNNVRNKLVHRICACVRENREFEKRNVA